MQKLCKVCTRGARFIIVQFDCYGLRINVDDTSKYEMGENVLVDYSGDIGKKNFQYCLANNENKTVDKEPETIRKSTKNTRRTKKTEEDKNE